MTRQEPAGRPAILPAMDAVTPQASLPIDLSVSQPSSPADADGPGRIVLETRIPPDRRDRRRRPRRRQRRRLRAGRRRPVVDVRPVDPATARRFARRVRGRPVGRGIGRPVRGAVARPLAGAVGLARSRGPRRRGPRGRHEVPRRRVRQGRGRRQPAQAADARRRRQGLRVHGRRDPAQGRRGEGPGRGARVRRDVARTAARRRRGRQDPGDLQEQPAGVDRHPFPRPAAAEQHGRRSH